MPKPSAAPGAIRPAGIGRLAVRRMIASMSRSYHMLIAPAAPGADGDAEDGGEGQHRVEMARRDQRPIAPVNTTRVITRGFSSASQS